MSKPYKQKEADFYSQIPTAAAEVLSSMRDSIGQGFCLSGKDGIIRDVNQHFAEWLGYKKDEMIQKQFSDFIFEKLRPYARIHLHEFFSQQSESRVEVWDFEDRHGQVIVLEVKSSQVKLDKSVYKIDILTKSEEKDSSVPDSDSIVLKDESRHLFKNTLQEINGLLQLQAAQLQGETRDIFWSAQKRTEVIALAFDQLYKHPMNNEIELSAYLAKVLNVHRLPEDTLLNHPRVMMNISRCYALGLILNEFLLQVNGNIEGLKLSGQVTDDAYFFRLSSNEDKGKVNITGLGRHLLAALQRQLMAEQIQDDDSGSLLNLSIPL